MDQNTASLEHVKSASAQTVFIISQHLLTTQGPGIESGALDSDLSPQVGGVTAP